MESAVRSKANRAAQYDRTCQAEFAGLEHDGFVERVATVAVGFANEDSQQFGFDWQFYITGVSLK